VLAHDDQSRLYLSRRPQDFQSWHPDAGVDGEAAEQGCLAPDSTPRFLAYQFMLSYMQNVQGRSLDLTEHHRYRERRQRLFCTIERDYTKALMLLPSETPTQALH
jgi:hypothetical protein